MRQTPSLSLYCAVQSESTKKKKIKIIICSLVHHFFRFDINQMYKCKTIREHQFMAI